MGAEASPEWWGPSRLPPPRRPFPSRPWGCRPSPPLRPERPRPQTPDGLVSQPLRRLRSGARGRSPGMTSPSGD
ncbi:hypothetical protein DN402_10290 [Streptomyces sp. SW4]|nr:hypothetical protein DN402_10290 [Streptomyces sp. SW4]